MKKLRFSDFRSSDLQTQFQISDFRGRRTGRQECRQTDRQTDRPTDRLTDRQAQAWAGGQADRQTVFQISGGGWVGEEGMIRAERG